MIGPSCLALTPVEHLAERGIWLKRDDLFEFAGVRGGKVRSCRAVAERAERGLVTAGSRHSPQVEIVAAVGRELGLPVCVVVPAGEPTDQLSNAESLGAELLRVRPGYNSVIIAAARAEAERRGWSEVPFGMECWEAIAETSRQAANLPQQISRVVVPVGSGMSLAGILTGLLGARRDALPVLGIQVGADPSRRLDRWFPFWRAYAEILRAPEGYGAEVDAELGGVQLDPVYEAKCAQFLAPGDLLWIVGARGVSGS